MITLVEQLLQEGIRRTTMVRLPTVEYAIMISPVVQLLPKSHLWMSVGHVADRQNQAESEIVHQGRFHRNSRNDGDHAPLFQVAGAKSGYRDREHMEGSFSAFNLPLS